MGKASLPKTSINDTLDANKERKKQFGRERGAFSRVSGVAVNSGSGVNATSNNIVQVPSLQTAGGTMMGPVAFYPRLAFLNTGVTTLDISKSTGTSYSSRVIVSGQSNAATVSTISGAAHAGQIIFLQAASAQTITINETGNISIPGSISSYVMTANEIILLQYDTTTSKWITVTLGATSSGVGLADNNVWTGTNTFQNVVTMTGSAVTIGDASSDVLNILSGLGSSINVNTHDLQNIDRALFSTTGTDNLGSSDMGIGTNSNDGNYLTYNVPTGYQRFKVGGTLAMSVGPTLNPGLTVENQLYVNGALTSTGNTAFNGNVDIGNSSGDSLTISSTLDAQLKMGNNKITSLATPTTDYDAATKKYVDDNSGGGSSGANTSLSNLTSTGEAHFVKLGNGTAWTAVQHFNQGIDLNGADIDDVETITFDTNNIQIAGASNGLTYTVPSSDAHYFVVDGGTKLQIGSNYTYSLNTLSPGTAGGSALGSSSLPWAGLWCSSIEGTGAWITSGSLSVGGDVWLGNAAADDIHISGTMDTSIKMGANDVDFATGGTVDFYDIASSTVSAGGAQVLPSNPTGYFKVKFRGSDRYIPYYS